ncbi:hypothetical protein [Quadrisphaera granulorum]|nr:hypothetical protein [Quadrisphaera granulorum]
MALALPPLLLPALLGFSVFESKVMTGPSRVDRQAAPTVSAD